MGADLGLKAMAITDHDTVVGIKDGRKAAARYDIRFFPGIEISTQKGEEIHILGYNIDEDSPKLIRSCEQYEKDRLGRGERICDFFNRRDIPMMLDEVKTIAGEGSLGRPHFAAWLMEKGYVSDRRVAFSKYLDTKEFHEETDRIKPTPEFAIELIHKAGGRAVLAHPGLLKMSEGNQEILIRDLTEAGLDGIEAFYNRHKTKQTNLYIDFARRFDLKLSCGSDFHGEKVKPDVKLGMVLNYDFLNKLVVNLAGEPCNL